MVVLQSWGKDIGLFIEGVVAHVASGFAEQYLQFGVLVHKSLEPSVADAQIGDEPAQILGLAHNVASVKHFPTVHLVYRPLTQLDLQFLRQIIAPRVIVYLFPHEMVGTRLNYA